MAHPLFVVDAFTDRAFAGNPAAVVILDAPAPPEWCQAVAAEMNLSETAFVSSRPDDTFDLSWFTPSVEVDLCGHATLASAHVLREAGGAADDTTVVFHTRSGALAARFVGDRIELDFPSRPPARVACSEALVAALGAAPDEMWSHAEGYEVAVFADPETVRDLRPDHAALRAYGRHGIIVTAAGDVDAGHDVGGACADFVSRYFAPGAGIEEDPVTGSAHCVLAPLWAERLGSKLVTGHQVSARGGRVECEIDGDRVLLRGRAVTVVRGSLAV